MLRRMGRSMGQMMWGKMAKTGMGKLKNALASSAPRPTVQSQQNLRSAMASLLKRDRGFYHNVKKVLF